jgi:hypothetical protein
VSNQSLRKADHFDVVKSNYALNIISDYEGNATSPNRPQASSLNLSGGGNSNQNGASVNFSSNPANVDTLPDVAGKHHSRHSRSSSSNIGSSQLSGHSAHVPSGKQQPRDGSVAPSVTHSQRETVASSLRETTDSINLSPRKMSATTTKRKLDYSMSFSLYS